MRTYILLALISLVAVAHVFLWLSDMPTDLKWRLTALNALGWTVVLAPIFLVGRWLAAVETRNRRER